MANRDDFKMEPQDYIRILTERYPELSSVETEIRKALEMLISCYENGGKVLAGGNGGSAADCEHFAGELMKSFAKKRRISPEEAAVLRELNPERGARLAEELEQALPVIVVSAHVGLTTAYANDKNWLTGYAQQVYGYGKPGDVLFAVTTSGNSANLLYAVDAAHARGMKVIALTGRGGGEIAKIADCSIIVPRKETYQIQELHLPVYHALCLQIEEHFFPV